MNELNVTGDLGYLSHEIFCDTTTCLVQDYGVPMYFDSGHLTLTGANKLAHLFSEIAEHIQSKK